MTRSYVLFVVSGMFFFIAFLPYIRAIRRKKISPRKATWLVWFLSDVIILSGMIAKGTINGIMVVAVFGAGTTFLLSWIYGEAGWNRRERVCITFSGLAIALWLYFGESNLGIAFSLLSITIAAWPTFVSAFHTPERENRTAWILFNIANILALLAIPDFTFADVGQPVTFAVIDGIIFYLVVVRPYRRIRQYAYL